MTTPTDSRSVATRPYVSEFSITTRIRRALWGLSWTILCRPCPRPLFFWRRWIAQLFGARLHPTVRLYPGVKIFAPWNLEMGFASYLGDNVDCYCVDKITIGANTIVSQDAFLCTATHDISDPDRKLVHKPITIGSNCWVFSRSFVGPGVTVGDGAVVAAMAVVVKNVDPWTIVGGNPAKFIKPRTLRKAGEEPSTEVSA